MLPTTHAAHIAAIGSGNVKAKSRDAAQPALVDAQTGLAEAGQTFLERLEVPVPLLCLVHAVPPLCPPSATGTSGAMPVRQVDYTAIAEKRHTKRYKRSPLKILARYGCWCSVSAVKKARKARGRPAPPGRGRSPYPSTAASTATATPEFNTPRRPGRESDGHQPRRDEAAMFDTSRNSSSRLGRLLRAVMPGPPPLKGVCNG